MKYKTSELTGELLDAAVAKALYGDKAKEILEVLSSGHLADGFLPSTNWAHGGPIIDRYQIRVDFVAHRRHFPSEPGKWFGTLFECMGEQRIGHESGATPLIAAMRAFVFAIIGDAVDL